jgi:hypothetical protein
LANVGFSFLMPAYLLIFPIASRQVRLYAIRHTR